MERYGGRRFESGSTGPPTVKADKGRSWPVVLFVVAIVVALIVVVSWLGGYSKSGPNQACVVYNGGWLDKKDQRQTLPASSGRTWTGFFSQDCRYYPTVDSPRRYIITSDPKAGDKAGYDYLEQPTADGYNMRLNAKISFHSNFNGKANGRCHGGHDPGNNCDVLLSVFDARYGNRLYPTPDGKRVHVWQGDDGIGAFENVEVRPVVDNAVRTTLAKFKCTELYSPCAYASSGGKIPNPDQVVNQGNQQNLVAVQNAIRKALDQDLATNLGCLNGPSDTDVKKCSDGSDPVRYFGGFQVLVSNVKPDPVVQNAISTTLGSFADANKALSDLKAANIKLQTNKKLQKSYSTCAACATQDILKAHPQPFALGSGASLAIK